MHEYDLVIIGGGPAGLAAAFAASENGIKNILILERENKLGGILNQCIHNGFGLHIFKEELTGPEYADRYVSRILEKEIEFKLNTMVIDITMERLVTAVNSIEGIIEIKSKTIILTMGCRERPRGAINIPGSRCSGIYTAGTAQKYVNLEGLVPGKKVVILGSGDIGLIMARRMTLEGAKVEAVIELMPYSTGLKRNIVQCLMDFNIPLKLSHTITKIVGKERLEGVFIAQVDENKKPIKETEEFIVCDTMLLSVGLLPENELSQRAGVELSKITGGPKVDESMQTSVDGVFACGNVLHVHDLVDNVSTESYIAGASAAKYLKGELVIDRNNVIKVRGIEGVRYTVPKYINPDNVEGFSLIRFRVDSIYKDCYISVFSGEDRVLHIKKKVLTPGEMEAVKILPKYLESGKNLKDIIIKIERI